MPAIIAHGSFAWTDRGCAAGGSGGTVTLVHGGSAPLEIGLSHAPAMTWPPL